jgi:hypothetical protein
VQNNDAGSYSVVITNAYGSATRSNALLVVQSLPIPVHLDAAGRAGNQFQFRVTGPPGGYVIQAATNLVDWVSVGTNASNSGVFIFSDSAPGNVAGQFYRVLQQ